MKIAGLRWWIVVLLFLAAVLNYVDRQTLSVLAPTIQHDLNLDDRAYSNVVNVFLLAYTISYLVSGRIVDRCGVRASTAAFVTLWSVANMLTASAQGVRSLTAYRFGLGLGEAGVWPAASKAVAEWFPASERAFAIGCYTMGATLGAAVAPYIVVPIGSLDYESLAPTIHRWLGAGAGWRMAFLLTGGLGIAWLVPWTWFYCRPQDSRLLRADELRHILKDNLAASDSRSSSVEEPWTWLQALAFRATWLLLLARLLTDSVWYFFQFWFAKYLHTERGLDQEQLKITWIIYASAGIGSLFGGWLSGRLIARGSTPAAGRLWVMLPCAALMPLVALVPYVQPLWAAIALSAVVVTAALAWLINLTAIVVDVVPKHSLGTVFSLVAAGSTIGGILMNTIVASMLSNPAEAPDTLGFLDRAVHFMLGGMLDLAQGRGYGVWFAIMALLHPAAWILLRLGGIHRMAIR
jgi:MFS transporter, ACS family, hexuronate transporter